MTDEPVSLGFLLLAQVVQLAICLPVGLIALWLLRTRWLVHVQTLAVKQRSFAAGAWATLLTLGAFVAVLLPPLLGGDFSAQADGWAAFKYQVIQDQYASAGAMTAMFFVQALFEEVLFRAIGVVLLAMLLMWLAELLWLEPEQRRFGTHRDGPEPVGLRVWRGCAFQWSGLLALAVVAVGFALAHAHNAGITTLALVNIALAGLWLGLLFWRSVSLLAPWLAHFVWNVALALAGLPVSGFALLRDPLGDFGIDGAVTSLLSGGSFGPEASLSATLVFLILNAWLLRQFARDLRSVDAAFTSSDSGTAAERRTG